MSAIQRAVTGLYAQRGPYQSCQRDSKGQQRKLGKKQEPLKDQAEQINQCLRGHYAYDGIAGHVGSLLGGLPPCRALLA